MRSCLPRNEERLDKNDSDPFSPICHNPYLLPTLWGVPRSRINCIRTCLTEADKKAQTKPDNFTGGCPSCLKDDVINDYHRTCYTKCNVGTWRYPGVGPIGNE